MALNKKEGKKMAAKWIVVTTDKRGVFFGKGVDKGENSIVLKDAQMCIHWDSSIRGVLGLAKTGPNRRCRISPAIPSITLYDYHAVMYCTDEAVKAWKEMS